MPVKLIFDTYAYLINAYFLEDVIKLYQKHEYRFISLPEALEDLYYKT